MDVAGLSQIGKPLDAGSDHAIFGVAFSPDGGTLATADFTSTRASPRAVQFWDVAGHRQTARITGGAADSDSIAYSPDGRTVATGSYDGTVRLWDVSSRAAVAELKGHTGPVARVAFSPDGRTLASAGQDRTMRIWDTASHRLVWREGG